MSKCGRIRSIRQTDGARAFCVVDDGQQDYESHTLVREPKSCTVTKELARAIRNELLKLLSYFPDLTYFAQ